MHQRRVEPRGAIGDRIVCDLARVAFSRSRSSSSTRVPVSAAVTLMPLFYLRSTIETVAGEDTKADGRAAFTEGGVFCIAP